MSAGRPLLFRNRHPLNVLISHDDYESLRIEAQAIGQVQPGYSVGDLVRGYITQGLAQGVSGRKVRTADPKSTRVRVLRGIARSALQMARELKETA